MTRGAIVVIAARGAYTSKPRPALVVQSEVFLATHASVTICPITSDCVDAPLFRVTLPPGERTGLAVISQVMADKIVSVPRGAIVRTIGSCDSEEILAIDSALRSGWGWLTRHDDRDILVGEKRSVARDASENVRAGSLNDTCVCHLLSAGGSGMVHGGDHGELA